MAEEKAEWIPLGRVALHPRARPHSSERLKELMESMKTRGQLQPCRGRPTQDGKVQIYIGQGRFLSAKHLNWECIQVIVAPASDDDVDMAMLHENLKREDLDPISEAREYKYLLQKNDWTQNLLAELVGEPQPRIAEALALLDMEEGARELIQRCIISRSHGVNISKLVDKSIQTELANAVSEYDFSVSTTRELVNIANEQGKEAFWAVLKNFQSLAQKSGGDVAQSVVSAEKRHAMGTKDASGLWPGLPEGVRLGLEGSKIHLTWSKSRYPDVKDLIDKLAASAPHELPKLKVSKPRKSSKQDGPSSSTAQQ